MHPSTRLPLILAALLLGGVCRAQDGRGDVTTAIPSATTNLGGTAGLSLLDRTGGALTSLASQAQALADITTITASPWRMNRFVGATDGLANTTTPGECDILDIHADRGRVTGVYRLNAAPLAEGFLSALCVVGNDVYFQGQSSIGRVPLARGSAQTFYQYQPGDGAFGMTSDGRWLYAGVGARRIVRFDLADPTSFQQLALLPATIFDVLMALAIDRDGNLLAARGNPLAAATLLELDPRSGAVLRSRTLPLTGVRSLCVDPLTGEILVSGNNGLGGAVVALADFTAAPVTAATFQGEASITLRRSWPLHLHGPLCPTSDGRQPQATASGVPLRGSAGYALRLDTLPFSATVLLGGLHPGGFVDIATSLQPFGAPLCTLSLNVAAARLLLTDGAGRASTPLPIPNVGALRDVALDFQWIVLDPPANALGIATSQVGSTVVD